MENKSRVLRFVSFIKVLDIFFFLGGLFCFYSLYPKLNFLTKHITTGGEYESPLETSFPYVSIRHFLVFDLFLKFLVSLKVKVRKTNKKAGKRRTR